MPSSAHKGYVMNQDHWNQVDAYLSATLVPSISIVGAA